MDIADIYNKLMGKLIEFSNEEGGEINDESMITKFQEVKEEEKEPIYQAVYNGVIKVFQLRMEHSKKAREVRELWKKKIEEHGINFFVDIFSTSTPPASGVQRSKL